MNGLGAPAGSAGERAKPTPLLIRILMIGDSSVGKTSLVLRYDKRGFNLRFTTTIGVDYSDRLLDLRAKATLPEYRDHRTVEMTGGMEIEKTDRRRVADAMRRLTPEERGQLRTLLTRVAEHEES